MHYKIKPLEDMGISQDTKPIEGPIENITIFIAYKS